MPTTKATKATAAATATKAIKPAPDAVKARAAKAKPAPAPFVHAHADAGVSDNGKHLSSYLNANRKPRVAVGGSHKFNREPAQLTARTLDCFSAIRKAYGGKPFPARGLDNAIIAMLNSAGFISPVSGSGDRIEQNGTEFLTDNPEKPLKFKLTAAGTKYGQATA